MTTYFPKDLKKSYIPLIAAAELRANKNHSNKIADYLPILSDAILKEKIKAFYVFDIVEEYQQPWGIEKVVIETSIGAAAKEAISKDCLERILESKPLKTNIIDNILVNKNDCHEWLKTVEIVKPTKKSAGNDHLDHVVFTKKRTRKDNLTTAIDCAFDALEVKEKPSTATIFTYLKTQDKTGIIIRGQCTHNEIWWKKASTGMSTSTSRKKLGERITKIFTKLKKNRPS